jgi:parallel beta-helix repeat protein
MTSSHNRVVGCRITGCQRAGIKLLAADHITIRDCVIWGNNEHGIIIDKASTVAGQANKPSQHNTVTGCHIYENGTYGIYIRSSHYNKLQGLTIRNNGWDSTSSDGVRVTTGDSQAANGNVILGCVITDDQLSKTQAFGIRLLPSSGAVDRTVIGDNQLRGNKSGALLNGGSNTVASNNAQ